MTYKFWRVPTSGDLRDAVLVASLPDQSTNVARALTLHHEWAVRNGVVSSDDPYTVTVTCEGYPTAVTYRLWRSRFEEVVTERVSL